MSKRAAPATTIEATELVMTIAGGAPDRLGYARVSTKAQTLDAQLDALTAARCGRVYFDKASGAKASRPGLDELRRHLREGDTVCVTKLDRLGRTMVDLVNTLDQWCRQGVSFVACEQSIDTSTASGRMVCSMLAAVAEFELSMNHERTAAALEAKRARGIKGGRPVKVTPDKIARARKMLAAQTMTMGEIAEALGVGRSTLARHLAAATAG